MNVNVSIIKREYFEQFHNHMNALHLKFQLTMEEESDSELLFLDTLLKRKPDRTISLSIEKKHTLTNT